MQRTGSLFLPDTVKTMVFHDEHLYVSTPSWLYVVDVSIPARPRWVGGFYTGYEYSYLEVDGGLLIGIGEWGVWQSLDLWSLERPGEPRFIASYEWEGRLLGIENRIIYRLGIYHNWLEFIPLDDPEELYLYTGEEQLPDYEEHGATFWNFAISGQILYGISSRQRDCNPYPNCFYDNTIVTWSLANPAKPATLGQASLNGLNAPFYAWLLASGTSVVVVNWETLHFLDMSQPGKPVETGVYQAPAAMLDARLSGSQVRLVVDGLGLQVVAFGDGQAPRLQDEYRGAGRPEGVAMGSGIALAWSYFADRQFQAYDLTDIANPRRIEFDPGEGAALDVVYRDDLVYVLWETHSDPETTTYTLRVFDPASQPPLKQVAALDLTLPEDGVDSDHGRIRFDGDMLYAVFTGNDRYQYGAILGLDISDPANPVQVLTWDVEGSVYAWDIAFSGGYAYVLAGYHYPGDPELRIFDMRTPGTFTLVNRMNIHGNFIQIAGEYAYVAGSYIHVLNISRPDAPVEISAYRSDFIRFTDLQVWNRYLFTTAKDWFDNYYLLSLDTALPEQLSPAAVNWIPGQLGRIAMEGDILAVAAGDTGLDFYRLADPLPDPQSVTLSPGSGAQLEFNYSSGETLRLDFPAGAVSETVTVTVAPLRTGDQPGLIFTGLGFHLSAPGPAPLTFGKPVNVTLTYLNKGIRTVSDEAQLRLLRLDDPGSPDASQTCPEPQAPQRDLRANRFSIGLCQSGTYGLYGPTNWLYLPAIPKELFMGLS